jgi:hypothetical protein
MGWHTVLSVVGPNASPVGCSLPLGVVWGFVTQLGGVVAHIVVGPAGEQAVLGDVVHFQILSSI